MTMYRKWPIQGSASAGPLVVIMNQACVWWRTWSQWFNVNTKVFQSTDDKVALFPWATQEYKPKKLAALRQLAQTQSPGAVAHMTEKRWRFWTRSAEGPFNMTKKRASFVAFLPFTYTRMVPGVPKSANFWNRAPEWIVLNTLLFHLHVNRERCFQWKQLAKSIAHSGATTTMDDYRATRVLLTVLAFLALL